MHGHVVTLSSGLQESHVDQGGTVEPALHKSGQRGQHTVNFSIMTATELHWSGQRGQHTINFSIMTAIELHRSGQGSAYSQ